MLFRIAILACILLVGQVHGQCTVHQTPAASSAGVSYLDQHNVICPSGQLMNQFRLVRPSGSTMAYQYRCCPPGESYQCYQRTTPVSEAGNVNYLDRQDIDCGKDYLLYSHQFENSGGGYRYRFYCCVATPQNCDTHYTAWNHDGVGNVIYLDRHDVVCPNSKILQQFKLETGGINMRYRYTCCDAAIACTNPYDRFDRVQTCDARSSQINLHCTYERTVGASRTNSQSEGSSITTEVSSVLETTFGNMGYSQTTQHDWRTETGETYTAERKSTMSFDCPPGTLCYLDQAVGYCTNGNYRVRSNYFRLTTQ